MTNVLLNSPDLWLAVSPSQPHAPQSLSRGVRPVRLDVGHLHAVRVGDLDGTAAAIARLTMLAERVRAMIPGAEPSASRAAVLAALDEIRHGDASSVAEITGDMLIDLFSRLERPLPALVNTMGSRGLVLILSDLGTVPHASIGALLGTSVEDVVALHEQGRRELGVGTSALEPCADARPDIGCNDEADEVHLDGCEHCLTLLLERGMVQGRLSGHGADVDDPALILLGVAAFALDAERIQRAA